MEITYFENNLWKRKCARNGCNNLVTNIYKSQLKQKFCSHSCHSKGNTYRKGYKPANAFKKRDTRIMGANNPNWKGGVSKLAEKIRRLPEYKAWRKAVFERDDYTCQNKDCGERGVYLHADHYPVMFYKILENNKINSIEKALASIELWNIACGQTLCKKCHRKKTDIDLKLTPHNPAAAIAYNKARKNQPRPTHACLYCGKIWEIPIGGRHHQQYCSRACAANATAKHDKRTLTCQRPDCINTWEAKPGCYGQKYCSPECVKLMKIKSNKDRIGVRYTGHSSKVGLRGVGTQRNGRFTAFTKVDGKKKHLGTYDTPEQASKAYQKACAA